MPSGWQRSEGEFVQALLQKDQLFLPFFFGDRAGFVRKKTVWSSKFTSSYPEFIVKEIKALGGEEICPESTVKSEHWYHQQIF